MKKMESQPLFLSLLLLLLSSSVYITYTSAADAPSNLAQKCSSEINKMLGCLDFSSGKASEPSSECCSSVKDIRSKDAVCLCYIVQQTYEGLPALKQLGLKVDRLLQLPSGCKLTNTSSSDCQALLNLSPTSPEYAIFSNSSSAATSRSSNTTTTVPKSSGYVSGPHFTRAIIMISAAIFSTVHG